MYICYMCVYIYIYIYIHTYMLYTQHTRGEVALLTSDSVLTPSKQFSCHKATMLTACEHYTRIACMLCDSYNGTCNVSSRHAA